MNVNIINNELKYKRTMFIYFLDIYIPTTGYLIGRFVETLFYNDNIPICLI